MVIALTVYDVPSLPGLFRNTAPKRIRRLAIPEHAEDLSEILRVEQLMSVDVLIGWSMGVQVTLHIHALRNCPRVVCIQSAQHHLVCYVTTGVTGDGAAVPGEDPVTDSTQRHTRTGTAKCDCQ